MKISDYARTLYIRTHWSTFNPAEGVYGWDTNEKLKKVIQGALDRGMRLSFRVVVDSRDRKNEATPAYVLMQEPNTIQTMENALPILMTLSSRRNMQSS